MMRSLRTPRHRPASLLGYGQRERLQVIELTPLRSGRMARLSPKSTASTKLSSFRDSTCVPAGPEEKCRFARTSGSCQMSD